jgi:hypothetical protein
VDASCAAYDKHPLDEPDECGDLASFRQARSRLVTALPARGELWWCEMAEIGRRPVVVLSRKRGDPSSSSSADRTVYSGPGRRA